MSSTVRTAIVVAIGLWVLGTAVPDLRRIVRPSEGNGLSVSFDGVVTAVAGGSPAAAASIAVGDRIASPLPHELFREPAPPLSFTLVHGGAKRSVTLASRTYPLALPRRLLRLALYGSYLVFLIVGSMLLLLRPSAMTWAFYLYCVGRRYGDLGFYWPGSKEFFWSNALAFIALGATSCALVMIFALRFPADRLDGWRRWLNRVAWFLLVVFAVAWPAVVVRLNFFGLPSQSLADILVLLTSAVYLVAAAIFIATLIESHGDERQRLRWILIFPIVLVLRIVAIYQGNGLLPYSLPEWFPRALTVLAIAVPLVVGYAVIRRRVFDIEFVVSRAIVYGSITSIVAGTFLLLDWFMSKQFAKTQFTLTAEILVALAIGSCLSLLHRNVDRFIDSTFFRQRHLAEQRLAKAAAAVLRAESHESVDRFLVHEPVRALDLVSAALFHRHDGGERFVREVEVGWSHAGVRELLADDPLVLHLLAEAAPVHLADVTWSSDELPALADAVLATPVLLRDELVAIVFYGHHRSGADVDPDEVRSIMLLVERAGAAYDHIEARALRAQVESLVRESEAKQREIDRLRAEMSVGASRPAPESPSTA
jgi:hypothetical protein